MKIIVIYYGYGNHMKMIAERIKETLECDILRILPKVPYSNDYQKVVDKTTDNLQTKKTPEIEDININLEDYDKIILGTPVWWSDMPQIMYTFFELYDFSGKTVIPFSTHGGSGLAGTISTIKSKLTGANVESNAFTMSRNDMEQAPQEIKSWLKRINKLS